MRYVRLRRLSIAAVALAAEDTSILEVALEAGYSSHKAFTRAFRDHFGHTPKCGPPRPKHNPPETDGAL